ncbi:mediator of RNA polymerase II transcription subunit 20a-like [Olea europaea subsp. europaea]|uniref:Mediator of RNA polymerase II transcription subunit 20 n=1 Tax=Olea europaea subsp. europaea TaxID=158383 RepID=A0A8S0S6Q5_OLEEU|nr:mediator of RNA polymerase II transcription subunit 20a-like [Olea europaea subsp. europaea]
MPIKWILHWQPNVGTMVNSQILAEVSQCAEGINGVKEGCWKATISFYRAMTRDQANVNEFPRDFLGISLSELPIEYSVLDRLTNADTDPNDVSVLRTLYGALNSPQQLSKWSGTNGDPCGESWTGITCSAPKLRKRDFARTLIACLIGNVG